MQPVLLHLAALAALAALAVAALTAPAGAAESAVSRRGPRLWAPLAVALAGTVLVVWLDLQAGWRPGLAPALWMTVAATLALFAAGALAAPALARLDALLAPYLLLLAVIATIWAQAPARPLAEDAPAAWLNLHIVMSVATYALFTLAAIAGAAVYVQERALKARRPTRLTAVLPAVADGERLQRILMTAAAVVLGLGLASGMAIEWRENGRLFEATHKTVFALAAFGVIVALIAADRLSGLAGRRAARLLLLAYLFLTLAYPGVKFVTDVLLGRG